MSNLFLFSMTVQWFSQDYPEKRCEDIILQLNFSDTERNLLEANFMTVENGPSFV